MCHTKLCKWINIFVVTKPICNTRQNTCNHTNYKVNEFQHLAPDSQTIKRVIFGSDMNTNLNS